jgi:hypothetical protein
MRSEVIDCGHLGFDAVQSCRWLQTLRRNVPPPSSERFNVKTFKGDIGLLGYNATGLLGRYQRFGGKYCLHLQPSKWRKHLPISLCNFKFGRHLHADGSNEKKINVLGFLGFVIIHK